MLIPVMIEESCSEINFKKRDSDFAGMIEVVIGIVFVPIDAVNPPIFSTFCYRNKTSVIEE